MAGKAVAHVLVFPFPAQGHVRAALKFAELLTSGGLYVTFVNTEHIHRRLMDSFSDVTRPQLRFRTIPDGLPDDHARSLTRFTELQESLGRSREQYRELLAPGKDRDGWPPVTCVVADVLLPLTSEVAEEMRIPVMFLVTASACCTLAYCSISRLIEQGEIPLAEEADMDELVQGIPGMETFLRRRDLPSFLRDARSADDPLLQFRIKMCADLARGRALILNTIEAIESLVLPHLRSFCPIVYPLGPIPILLNNIDNKNNNKGVLSASSNSANIWQEDKSCITWLDSQPDRSVVYVSFGSIAVVSKDTLLEFWHGLVSSGRRFLWVIRPDMVENGTTLSDVVPQELIEERGRVVAWAPQEEVLAHRAVGCFLTHSGWNSTLESIVAGVPMICWPYFADQQINSRFVSEVWKVGVDMKDLSRRSVVEKMVREVMDGERAEELKRTTGEMAAAVRRSCEPGGSSYRNLENLVGHIRSLNTTDA